MAGPVLGFRRASAGRRAAVEPAILTFGSMDGMDGITGMPRPPDPPPGEDGRRAKPNRGKPDTGKPRERQIVTKQIVTKKPDRTRRDRPRGKASAALKAMRVRVAKTEGFPFLSQRQMAVECYILNEKGSPSTSTYQYYEDDYADDYFTLTLVKQLMPPLVARGIPEDDVKICLLGDVSFAVASPSDQAVRRVPVFARTAVGLVARGDIDITSISKSSPADLQRWEAAGVITGHEWLPGVTDTMLVFDLGDGACGSSTLVTVDTAARDLVPGKSFVYSPGPDHDDFVFATLADDGMVIARGPGAGSPVRFDPRRDYLVGQVVLFIERM